MFYIEYHSLLLFATEILKIFTDVPQNKRVLTSNDFLAKLNFMI